MGFFIRLMQESSKIQRQICAVEKFLLKFNEEQVRILMVELVVLVLVFNGI